MPELSNTFFLEDIDFQYFYQFTQCDPLIVSSDINTIRNCALGLCARIVHQNCTRKLYIIIVHQSCASQLRHHTRNSRLLTIKFAVVAITDFANFLQICRIMISLFDLESKLELKVKYKA